MTLLGEVLEAALQLFIDGGAEWIHRRYGVLGCLITIGVIALVVTLFIWGVS